MTKTYTLPTINEIESLHRKYAPNPEVFELVWTHCQIVADIAVQLAERSEVTVDTELVRVGCLLHDIGVYTLYAKDGYDKSKPYITHGIRGEEVLISEGLPVTICRFASHHTGAGLTKRQIVERHLPLPARDFLAETPEEALVMYADKFHSKSMPPHFNSYEYYTAYVIQFGDEASASFSELAAMFGKPDLAPLMAKYGHSLREE